jgi:hypothetical protein
VRVEIRLLGGFTVSIDGVRMPEDRWRHRPAAALVKLIAMAPEARLHRDRVLDALWPDVGGCDDLLAPRGLAPFRDMAETLPTLAAALSGDVFLGCCGSSPRGPTVVVPP